MCVCVNARIVTCCARLGRRGGGGARAVDLRRERAMLERLSKVDGRLVRALLNSVRALMRVHLELEP